jgi:hypothetical protein
MLAELTPARRATPGQRTRRSEISGRRRHRISLRVGARLDFSHAFSISCMISDALTVLLLVTARSHAGATRMTG